MSQKFIAILLTALGFTLSSMNTAEAQRFQRDLERAANDYREVVKDFEREVFRTRQMGTTQRRLADDLEDQTSRIRSAVRDRNGANRALQAIDRATLIQTQIEATVFGNPNCPSRGVLFPLWQRVLAGHAALAAQAQAVYGVGLGGFGFGGNGFGGNGFGGNGLGTGGVGANGFVPNGLSAGGFIDAAPAYGNFQPRYGAVYQSNRPLYGSYYRSAVSRYDTVNRYGYGVGGGYGIDYGVGAGYGPGVQPTIETRVYRVNDNCGPTGFDIGRAVIGALLQR